MLADFQMLVQIVIVFLKLANFIVSTTHPNGELTLFREVTERGIWEVRHFQVVLGYMLGVGQPFSNFRGLHLFVKVPYALYNAANV